MEMYENYHYWGMHLIWWFIWIVLLLWIFALPYSIPGQRSRKESPIEVIKKRFASGEINKEEYLEKRELLT